MRNTVVNTLIDLGKKDRDITLAIRKMVEMAGEQLRAAGENTSDNQE